jgi:hypothetical protein
MGRLPTMFVASIIGGALSAVLFVALSRQPHTRKLVAGYPLQYWVQCLDSGQEELRENARLNLPRFGVEAVDPLIERLDDDDPKVRLAAWSALQKIGAPALPRLAIVLRGDSAGGHATTAACRCAIIELLRTTIAAAGPATTETTTTTTTAMPAIPPAVVNDVADAVATQLEDRDVCQAAARYLVLHGVGPNGIAAAARALGGSQQLCQLQAIHVLLTEPRDPTTLAALSSSYNASDRVVRDAVRRALVTWPPPSPAPSPSPSLLPRDPGVLRSPDIVSESSDAEAIATMVPVPPGGLHPAEPKVALRFAPQGGTPQWSFEPSDRVPATAPAPALQH